MKRTRGKDNGDGELMGRFALVSTCSEMLRGRALKGGGFAMLPGGSYRPDATAWAVLSLVAAGFDGGHRDAIESGRSRLAESQSEDGRVTISPSDSGSFWPTPLAVLAWRGSVKHAGERTRAIDFLLRTSGKHWVRKDDSPLAHDTSIPGWAWTEETHSWVEPTSLAILALGISGFGGHARLREGVRMLMDRQLPSGGWNYGNTLAFGKEMYPQADCTGVALSALSGYVPRGEVERSLRYLRTQVIRLRTPLSLGWGILGLGAWGQRPKTAGDLLGECMSRQEQFGVYDTTLVSLILLALVGKEGPGKMFR